VTLFFSETMKEESRLFEMLCVTRDKKEGVRVSGSKDLYFEENGVVGNSLSRQQVWFQNPDHA